VAKKRAPPPAAAALASNWLVCAGYTLDVNNSDTAFVFELDARGSDNNAYFLRVKQLNDRTGLVQRVLRIIADRWPAYDWEFQADTAGSITDIR
jgi:hypothetical protein